MRVRPVNAIKLGAQIYRGVGPKVAKVEISAK
jgi:hypothetical protein